MTNKINTSLPVQPLVFPKKGKADKKADYGQAESFSQILKKNLQSVESAKDIVEFSAHAQKRLSERQIVLQPNDLESINQAVQKAAAKGAKDSLLIYGDLALVASIKNNTIVTALDNNSAKEHVFTNIDSAVIVEK